MNAVDAQDQLVVPVPAWSTVRTSPVSSPRPGSRHLARAHPPAGGSRHLLGRAKHQPLVNMSHGPGGTDCATSGLHVKLRGLPSCRHHGGRGPRQGPAPWTPRGPTSTGQPIRCPLPPPEAARPSAGPSHVRWPPLNTASNPGGSAGLDIRRSSQEVQASSSPTHPVYHAPRRLHPPRHVRPPRTALYVRLAKVTLLAWTVIA